MAIGTHTTLITHFFGLHYFSGLSAAQVSGASLGSSKADEP